MLDANVVRVLAALMAASFVVGVLAFQRRAHPVGGRHTTFRAEDNPPPILQTVWPLLVLIPQLYPFAVAIAPSITYGTVLQFSLPYASVLQVFGFLLWGAGGALVLWSGRTLGRFMVIQIAVAQDHELVTRGPYAWIRHPTYTGTIVMAVGTTLLFLSYVLAATAVLVIVVANYRAAKEERLLASEAGFGEAYRAYRARTGRFLPRLVPKA